MSNSSRGGCKHTTHCNAWDRHVMQTEKMSRLCRDRRLSIRDHLVYTRKHTMGRVVPHGESMLKPGFAPSAEKIDCRLQSKLEETSDRYSLILGPKTKVQHSVEGAIVALNIFPCPKAYEAQTCERP